MTTPTPRRMRCIVPGHLYGIEHDWTPKCETFGCLPVPAPVPPPASPDRTPVEKCSICGSLVGESKTHTETGQLCALCVEAIYQHKIMRRIDRKSTRLNSSH